MNQSYDPRRMFWAGLSVMFILIGIAAVLSVISNPHSFPTTLSGWLGVAGSVAGVLIGLFFLFILISALVWFARSIGWGPSQMGSFGTQLIPGILESKTFISIAGAAILTILGVNSFFNSALSSFNAGIRITYAIARDGILLPARLARIHPKFKSPHYVIFLNMIIALILTIPIGFAIGPLNTFLIEVTGLNCGILHLPHSHQHISGRVFP